MSDTTFPLPLAAWQCAQPCPPLTIRWEYSLLAEELPRYTKGFGFTLSPSQHRDAVLLTVAMDHIDCAVDLCQDAEQRREIYAQTARFVGGDLVELSVGSPQFRWTVQRLAEMLERRGLRARYQYLAEQVFACGEAKRAHTEVPEFLATLLRESELTCEFILSIVSPHPPEFRTFMKALGTVVNLADDLLDVGRDFREGAQSLKPSLALYRALLGALLDNVGRAVRAFPQTLRLCAWGLAYTPWVLHALGVPVGREDYLAVTPTVFSRQCDTELTQPQTITMV